MSSSAPSIVYSFVRCFCFFGFPFVKFVFLVTYPLSWLLYFLFGFSSPFPFLIHFFKRLRPLLFIFLFSSADDEERRRRRHSANKWFWSGSRWIAAVGKDTFESLISFIYIFYLFCSLKGLLFLFFCLFSFSFSLLYFIYLFFTFCASHLDERSFLIIVLLLLWIGSFLLRQWTKFPSISFFLVCLFFYFFFLLDRDCR